MTYTPDAGFSGKDWFTVAVTDDGSIYERSGPLTSEVMIEVKVGGCGCATTGSGGASALLSLLALVGLRRRQGLRRRR